MVRLSSNCGLYKAVDKLWKLGVNVVGSCAQQCADFGYKKDHKKSRPTERLFISRKSLRCFAVHRHSDVHQYVGVQSHADRMVARGFQRANWHADL